MPQNLPDPWNHVSGYRLNADGKAIKYEHPDSGLEAYIEAMTDPDADGLVYRPAIIEPSGEFAEYPEPIPDKDDALARLREWGEEYA